MIRVLEDKIDQLAMQLRDLTEMQTGQQKENARLKKDIDLLIKTIQERDNLVVALEAKVKEHQIKVANLESIAKALQQRNEDLARLRLRPTSRH